MIETKTEISQDLEKALKALQQVKQHVASERKKQNEKKRKAEVMYSPRLRGAHRYITRGGMCALRGARDSRQLRKHHTSAGVFL